MDMKFWQKQEPGKPLFPDVEWNKPERRDQAGKLGIIGGNKLGFLAVAESYQESLKTGVGEARVLLPDALKKKCSREYDRRAIRTNKPVGQSGKRSAH